MFSSEFFFRSVRKITRIIRFFTIARQPLELHRISRSSEKGQGHEGFLVFSSVRVVLRLPAYSVEKGLTIQFMIVLFMIRNVLQLATKQNKTETDEIILCEQLFFFRFCRFRDHR